MWLSRTQKAVSLLSMETEYMTMSHSVSDILFARQRLAFMRPRMKFETFQLFEDNEGAIHSANNSMGSAWPKHREIV